MQQPYFEEGEGTGHILASVVKAQCSTAFITEIQMSEHGKTNNTPEILEVFRDFYQELYKSRTGDREGDMKKFF